MSQCKPKNPATGRPRIRQTIYGDWYGRKSPTCQIKRFENQEQAREWLNQQLKITKL